MVDKKSTDNKKVEEDTKKVDSSADSSADKLAAKATPEVTVSSSAKSATKAKASVKEKSSVKDKPEKTKSTGAKTSAKGTKSGAKSRTVASTEPLSSAQKKAADNAIKSSKSSDDLKARAAAAKKRAQEKILEKSFVSDPPDDPLERLANTFDNSARRWEMVVYPSLFAFVLLAGYGFFLIYRLTHDIATLSQSVTHMAVIVSDAMPRMTKDLNVMTNSMDSMTSNIAKMSGDVGGMSTEISSMSGQMNSLTPMSKNIQSMTHNIGSMNRSVYGMQRDMHGMNRTVSSGPFGMMNDMIPFSSNSNVPPPVAPSPVWPSYNPLPPQQYGQYRGPAANNATNRAASKAPLKQQVVQPKNVNTAVTMPGASPVLIKETPVTTSQVKNDDAQYKRDGK